MFDEVPRELLEAGQQGPFPVVAELVFLGRACVTQSRPGLVLSYCDCERERERRGSIGRGSGLAKFRFPVDLQLRLT